MRDWQFWGKPTSMTFIRSMLALFFLSLLGGAGLLALGASLVPAWQSGGYAALICNEAVPDRDLRERLAGRGLGESLISESSQWVLLDNFDGLEQIPLDAYPSRVLPFDPRNDGYAERLRSFFVRDGKRLVFIPRGVSPPGSLDKRVAAAMGDIPYAIEYLGIGKPLGVFFLLFAAAVLGLLPLKLRMGQFLPCLPILAALALDGAWGFVLAAILTGLFALLREPALALATAVRYHRRRQSESESGSESAPPPDAESAPPPDAESAPPPESGPGGHAGQAGQAAGRSSGHARRSSGRALRRDVYEPFKARWLIALPLLICYPAACALAGFSPPLAAAIFAAFAAVMCFSARVFSLPRVGDYIRFSPVPLLKAPLGFGFAAAMAPFALAALLAALAPLLLPGSPSMGAAAVAGEVIIAESEYRDHAAFQAAFSRRPLEREDSPAGQAGYAAYVMDDDGLISPAPVPPPDTPDVPAFPLKHLMHFLETAAAKGTR